MTRQQLVILRAFLETLPADSDIAALELTLSDLIAEKKDDDIDPKSGNGIGQ